jgi:hypothetical protein
MEPGSVYSEMGVPKLDELEDSLWVWAEPFEAAMQKGGPIIALDLWKPAPYVVLLPSQLSLVWPDLFSNWPLNASYGIVPLTYASREWLARPIYSVGTAHEARRRARHARDIDTRGCANDFRHPDWEEALLNHPELLNAVVSADSVFAFDTVDRRGLLSLGSRRTFGRYAPRRALRPQVIAATPAAPASAAAERLSCVDLLLVLTTEARSQRAISLVQRCIRGRPGQPTLLAGSTPSEVLRVWDGDPLPTVVVSDTTAIPSVQTVLVNSERTQLEARYEYFIGELRGRSPELDRLVAEAQGAWWSAWQSLDSELTHEFAISTLEDSVHRFQDAHPLEATEVGSIYQLPIEVATDDERRQRLLEAIIECVRGRVCHDVDERVLVLVRNSRAIYVLKERLTSARDFPSGRWLQTQVVVVTDREPLKLGQADSVVVVGLRGMRTIDAMLTSRARHVSLVMDPIEARVMNHLLEQQIRVLTGASGVRDSLAALQVLADAALSVAAPRVGSLVTIDSYDPVVGFAASPIAEVVGRLNDNLPSEEAVQVSFSDGTTVGMARGHLLDILPAGNRRRFATTKADELQPGDIVLILESDPRQSFSQRLLDTLDDGILQPLADKRQVWSAMVSALAAAKKLNLSAIRRRIAEEGVTVGYAAVRSWVQRPGTDGTCPDSWQSFNAFSRAVGIGLPDDELRAMYDAIRKLRVLHRLAGRNLSKAMLAAAMGSLDVTGLERIESQWGFTARELAAAVLLA